MKYLYLDLNHGILEKSSAQKLKDELESDKKAIATTLAFYKEEKENCLLDDTELDKERYDDMISKHESYDTVFCENELEFCEAVEDTQNTSFCACVVSDTLYEKLDDKYSISR